MTKPKQISDRILRQAVKQREALKQELHEMDLFIRTFERLAASKDEEENEPLPPKAGGLSGVDPTLFIPVLNRPSEKTKVKSSPKRDVERVVRDVLELCGKPTATADILKMVAERGVTIGGQEPRWNLSAKMSRMEDIVSLENGDGWWFKDRPWHASVYVFEPKNEGPDE
jgi:hypothetical protein